MNFRMETLHDRINRVINTLAFEQSLEAEGVDLVDFQCTWDKTSGGDFDRLPPAYQRAILAGEEELEGCREVAFA